MERESSFAIPWGTHTGDVGCQVAAVLDKPLEPAFEIGEPLQKFGLQGLNREQRIKPTMERTFIGVRSPFGRWSTS